MRVLKKADVILAVGILLIALAFFLFFGTQKTGAEVVVESEGELYGTYSLMEDRIIEVEGNKIGIKSGEVFMQEADCSNQDCIRQGKKKKAGESIVCLPNKLVITVRGGENEVDAYTD